MKNLVFVCLSLASVIVLGCNRGQDQSATHGPRVALVMKTLNNPFFIDMQRGAEEAASRLGIDLIVQAAEREVDVEKQMQIIENLIQTRVDAICVTPSGSKEIIPAIAKANKAGIPVLVVDTRVDAQAAQDAGIKLETFIGSDNYQGGRIAGQYIVEKFEGKAKVAILEGIPGHETGDARLRGFLDGIKDTAGIEVIASQPANWERDQGFNVFQNILQAHRQIDALFACNDIMALGAIEAIAAAGRTGEIMVVGFDAVTDARQAIAAGTMAASVAHELRNPLNIIEATNDTIRKKYAQNQDEMFEYIPQEIRRLNSLIDDFLRFARTPQLHPETVDIVSLIERVKMGFPQEERERIKVSVETTDTRIYSDGNLLQQVLTNVTANALQAAPAEQAVQIIVKRRAKKQLYILVEDHGRGIPKEDLKQIFEPFFTTKEKGTGLGLAISKRLIQVIQGSIKVDSQVNKGTKVTIVLPELHQ